MTRSLTSERHGRLPFLGDLKSPRRRPSQHHPYLDLPECDCWLLVPLRVWFH